MRGRRSVVLFVCENVESKSTNIEQPGKFLSPEKRKYNIENGLIRHYNG